MTRFPDRLFVFEMANNHGGRLDVGVSIVRAMADLSRRFGIHAAIKLQFRDRETFVHPRYHTRGDVPHVQRFMETRLSDADRARLVAATRDAGLPLIVTPFDEVSVQTCLDLGVDVIKIASCSVNDWPLLEVVAATDRPVIVSTAGASWSTIDRVVGLFRRRPHPLALMHCVGLYPCPREHVQMRRMTMLKERYAGTVVGYSGHEAPDDLAVVTAAASLGAEILERHVGVASEGVSLNSYSLNPDQAARWVEAALEAWAMSGTESAPEVVAQERGSLQSLARGVYLRRAVSSGHTIERADVVFAFPCQPGQMTSGAFHESDHCIALQDYAEGDALMTRD